MAGKCFFKGAFVSLLLLFAANRSFAQVIDTLVDLDVQVLTYEKFLEMVRATHPMAKQADIVAEKGKMQLRKSRGVFDPYLEGWYKDKYFKESNYYETFHGGLVIPTWFGASVKAGWDYNDSNGVHFNEEYYTPSAGTAYLGVSVPVGAGLIMDKRRLELRKAQAFQQSSDQERILMLNTLLLDATKSYWDWMEAYNQLMVAERSLEIARVRIAAVQSSYEQGDLAAMDTLEAYTQLQAIQLSAYDARVNLQNTSLYLSIYLWDEEVKPLELTEKMRPVLSSEVKKYRRLEETRALVDSSEQLLANHPILAQYRLKMQALRVERRYKANNLLPKLKFEYSFLAPGDKLKVSGSNYKWGFSVYYPLFLREARGDLRIADLKLQETEFKLRQKNLELKNKLLASQNKLLTLEEQIKLYESASYNYQRLLELEEIKLQSGESSLFKVNERHQKMLNAQMKLLSLQTKYLQERAGLFWVAAVLTNFTD